MTCTCKPGIDKCSNCPTQTPETLEIERLRSVNEILSTKLNDQYLRLKNLQSQVDVTHEALLADLQRERKVCFIMETALEHISNWGGTTKFKGDGSYTDVARFARMEVESVRSVKPSLEASEACDCEGNAPCSGKCCNLKASSLAPGAAPKGSEE